MPVYQRGAAAATAAPEPSLVDRIVQALGEVGKHTLEASPTTSPNLGNPRQMLTALTNPLAPLIEGIKRAVFPAVAEKLPPAVSIPVNTLIGTGADIALNPMTYTGLGGARAKTPVPERPPVPAVATRAAEEIHPVPPGVVRPAAPDTITVYHG